MIYRVSDGDVLCPFLFLRLHGICFFPCNFDFLSISLHFSPVQIRPALMKIQKLDFSVLFYLFDGFCNGKISSTLKNNLLLSKYIIAMEIFSFTSPKFIPHLKNPLFQKTQDSL